MTTTPDGRFLRTFTIYENPRDHPGRFVVRGFTIRPGQAVPDPVGSELLADTLEEARRLVPAASDTRVPRQPGDDPVIVETWV